MLYFFSQLRDVFFGFNIFKYITFRAAMAAVTTFLVCILLGPVFTRFLKEKKIREYAKRADCPDLDKFAESKQGVPTMGGLFIISSIVISVLLWADLSNRYIWLTLGTCIYLTVLGFLDDWVKLTGGGVGKQRGLRPKTKLLAQIFLACFIGVYVSCDPSTSTTVEVPFLKNFAVEIGIFYFALVAVMLIGTTNAVNLTDGLDGLAIGCVLIVTSALAVLCYVSGHMNFSQYLFIPYIPRAAELTVFCTAMAGASLGFLWFNSHPATIFMGDAGSLPLGGCIAIIAVLIKKELLLFILGGVFVIEAASVILQVASFKLYHKRIFKMSPFHHHLQLSGWHESKIIIRFWIINIIFALMALMTLKIR